MSAPKPQEHLHYSWTLEELTAYPTPDGEGLMLSLCHRAPALLPTREHVDALIEMLEVARDRVFGAEIDLQRAKD